jgi:hypothetical protein
MINDCSSIQSRDGPRWGLFEFGNEERVKVERVVRGGCELLSTVVVRYTFS